MEKSAKDFFSAKQQEAIIQAIHEAEKETSGEIRVHIEKSCKEDVLDRTATLFAKLGMNKTQLRNGVLFYLAVHDHKFAVIGDLGINAKVPDDFWEKIKSTVLEQFHQNRYAKGLIDGIAMAGNELKAWFPYQKGDVNELPNDISFEK